MNLLPGVSLVICTRNGASRLPSTLAAIAAQKVPAGLDWEVLIVDNASNDGTAEVARRLWPDSPPAPLRITHEPMPGLSNARLRGLAEVHYTIISYVDDDNWLPPDWIEKVASFFQAHPDAAAMGGPSRGVFECTPPEWFSKVEMYYAIGTAHPASGDITDRPGTLLWGAGINVRTESLRELTEAGFRFLLAGGSPLQIFTSEDTELCFALRAAGGRIYYDSTLELGHFMPPARLTWEKALSSMRTMGKASPYLNLYLLAFDWLPYSRQSEYKKTWLFQTAKAFWGACKTFATHPVLCLRQPEGAIQALEFVRSVESARTWFSLYHSWASIVRSLRGAPWNKQSA